MKLFLSERIILGKLRELTAATGEVTISTRDLADACKVHRNSVVNGVRRLEEAGYLVVERRTEVGPGTSGKHPNTYSQVVPAECEGR